ncbi:MAG TPA: cation diffusion facilitator family transporter [Thermoanaerobaculia bacterium]|nr:cation diffusion facilitator family transporter [Thermoanaerobaculia bacterium]
MHTPPRRERSAVSLRHQKQGESVRTIIIALIANVVIAIAKLIAGLMSRSSGMMAEAAHSFADSLNEVLLGISVRRARQPPDVEHPLGHGREQFLWAFLAAIGSFLIGGCISIGLAIRSLERGTEMRHSIADWIVLAVAFVADGTSWLQSMRQARTQAKEFERTVYDYLVRASDPTVRAVVVEDSAALIGLVIAAGGLLVSKVTNSGMPDAIASLLIGILLAVTAVLLARPLADFLVGRSLPVEDVEELEKLILASPCVEQILSLQAVYSGPEEVIVAAKIHPKAGIAIDELAREMDALDQKIRAQSQLVADVFLDLTARRFEDLPKR